MSLSSSARRAMSREKNETEAMPLKVLVVTERTCPNRQGMRLSLRFRKT